MSRSGATPVAGDAFWSGLRNEYDPQLRSYLARVASGEDMHDLLSEVWAALRIGSGFPPSGELRDSLFKCARAAAAEHMRRRLPVADIDVDLIAGLVGPSDSEVAQQAVLEEWALQRLALLSPQQREVFRCCAMFGMSTADVADELGCSEGTVRVHLHRARMALRQFAAEYSHPPPRNG